MKRTAFALGWRALLCSCLAIFLTACVNPADNAASKQLNAAFDTLEAKGFTGYAVIAKDGEFIFARGAGEANALTHAPFTLATQVDIGSITKSLTGMIAADMIARGEIGADATLGEFYPEAPENYAAITLQQLLTHTAGLADVVGDDHEAANWEEIRERAFTTSLIAEPGAQYIYSNLGYSFVAGIIEKVKGASYDAVLRSYLAKAGIGATGYMSAADAERMVVFADGQSAIDASWGGHAPGWNLIGNGGVLSTPQDMINWMLAYRQGRIIPDEAVALARTPFQAEDPSGASYYGYGLVVEDNEKLGRIYWHNGGSERFNAHWRDLDDRNVVIFAAANQWSVTADEAVFTLTKALFADEN